MVLHIGPHDLAQAEVTMLATRNSQSESAEVASDRRRSAMSPCETAVGRLGRLGHTEAHCAMLGSCLRLARSVR